MTDKQATIINYLKNNHEIDLATTADLVCGNVYYNKKHHASQTLKRMIDNGMLKRKRIGVYILNTKDLSKELPLFKGLK